jgi:hypothetical protein
MTSVMEPEQTAGTDRRRRRGAPPPIEAAPTGTLPSGTAIPPGNPDTATNATCPTQTDVALIAKPNQ